MNYMSVSMIIRLLISVTLLAGIHQKLAAQDSNLVHVFSRYLLYGGKTYEPGPYFISRQLKPLTASEKEKILLCNTRRVRDAVKRGEIPVEYEWSFGLRAEWPLDLGTEYLDKFSANDLHPGSLQLTDAYSHHRGSQIITFSRRPNGETACRHCSIDTAGRIIVFTDTVFVEDAKKKKYLKKPVPVYLDPANASVFFGEDWHFDFNTGHFEKDVRYIGIARPQCNDFDSVCWPVQVICLENPANNELGSWTLLRKNCITDIALNFADASMGFRYATENPDIGDVFAYRNIADGTIPEHFRYPFLAGLIHFAMKNPERVCPVSGDGVVDEKHPYKTNFPIKDAFTKWDSTAQFENPDNPGTYFISAVKLMIGLNDIYAIRFYEDWYINEKSGAIRKEVHGISFLRNDADLNGSPVFTDFGIYLRTR